jgi:hypothetical protein
VSLPTRATAAANQITRSGDSLSRVNGPRSQKRRSSNRRGLGESLRERQVALEELITSASRTMAFAWRAIARVSASRAAPGPEMLAKRLGGCASSAESRVQDALGGTDTRDGPGKQKPSQAGLAPLWRHVQRPHRPGRCCSPSRTYRLATGERAWSVSVEVWRRIPRHLVAAVAQGEVSGCRMGTNRRDDGS